METIIECAIYVLAIYGLISLIFSAAGLIRCKAAGRRPDVKVVLLVKNAQEVIEYIVHNAARKDVAPKLYSDRKLAIIDMNSGDDTPLILEKLQKDYSNIEIFTYDERELVFRDFISFHS